LKHPISRLEAAEEQHVAYLVSYDDGTVKESLPFVVAAEGGIINLVLNSSFETGDAGDMSVTPNGIGALILRIPANERQQSNEPAATALNQEARLMQGSCRIFPLQTEHTNLQCTIMCL
jgi:hypothetical protein